MKRPLFFHACFLTGVLGMLAPCPIQGHVNGDNRNNLDPATSDTLKVGFREGTYTHQNPAYNTYKITLKSPVSWLSVKTKKDKLVFQIEANTSSKPRNATFVITDRNRNIATTKVICQLGDTVITSADYAQVAHNFINERLNSQDYKEEERKLESFVHFCQADGSFSDIDYADRHRVLWESQHHYFRLQTMASLYIDSRSKYYKNEKIYNQIVKALEFWYKRNPRCNNWWFNQIGYTTGLSFTLLLMREGEQKVPKELEEKLLLRLKRDVGSADKSFSGANQVWVATCILYQAILTEDLEKFRHNLDLIYKPLHTDGYEGFQIDGGFFQHGPQFFLGGYGAKCIEGILQVALQVEHTKFAQMSQRQMELLSDVVRHSLNYISRGQSYMFSTDGRGITRNERRNAAIPTMMKQLEYPNHAEEYDDMIARITGTKPTSYHVKPSNTHFFLSDYMVHVRPDFSFDCRLLSKRTMPCEEDNGNYENYLGHFVSYGSTNITRTGEEYIALPPFWNWARVPGTTAPQRVPACVSVNRPGTNTFCGGVSDSIYGAAAFEYFDSYDGVNTGARKSWFCFDKEIVCLGNVNSTAAQNVMTSMNQCYNNNTQPVYRVGGKTFELPLNDSVRIEKPEWVFHNGVGYVMPNGGEALVVSKTVRTTRWTCNHNLSKDSVEEDVFTIAMEHGRNPVDAPIAYILVPSVKSPRQLASYCKRNPIEIVSNTKDVQSVYQKKLYIWQSVFFEAGELSHKGITVTSDRRCAWMLKKSSEGHYELHVSDPGYTERDLHLTVKLPGQDLQNITVRLNGTGKYKGKSQKFILS